MKNNKTLTVILSWNEIELTRRCIKSIIDQTYPSDILVIDNKSSINTLPELKKEFPSIFTIQNTKNLGVAGGRNIGIKYALDRRYNFILLMDNDAYAHKNLLYHFSEAEKEHKDVGIFGPKILRDDKKQIIWRAGCKSWKWVYLHSGSEIIKRLFLIYGRIPLRFDLYRGINQMDQKQFDKNTFIDFQIGCTQYIRSKVFRDIGLLDEEYSPYGSEDIDFCARAQNNGWKILYVYKAKSWHRDIGSIRDEYFKNYNNHKNLLLLARKNLGPLHFFLLFLPDYFFIIMPLAIMDNYFRKKPLKLKAFFDAFKWNLKDSNKRSILLSNPPKLPDSNLMHTEDISSKKSPC